MRRNFFVGLAIFLILAGLAVIIYYLPPVHQRLSWRVASLRSQVYYIMHPPDQVALSPETQVQAIVQATLAAMASIPSTTPTATFTLVPTQSGTPLPSPSPTITQTPPPTSTSIPARIALAGIRHEWQSFNNCGPANLAMALSHWGWQGDQRNTKAVLRPNEDDANVMPDEMAAFAVGQAGLNAVIRNGGTLERLKQLVAAGFPVVVEMGHQPSGDWWLGHYVVVSGYDDGYGVLITQDSLIMPDLPVPYQDIEEQWWRDFNRLYVVIYPAERQQEVEALLGADADPQENILRSMQATDAEIPQLAGRDLFFALYNKGADWLALGRVEEAVATFDLAFAQYQMLEDKERPWRVLWYRTEAYQAYYQAGRYQSVLDLANATLSMLSKRGLEESHYWRGMAYEAMGERDRALSDYEIAVILRPTYDQAIQALERLR